jgi:putative ABC transport system substrate-binding protein
MAGAYVDPVDAGFVASLARPGGNITGITNLEAALHPKRLELLKEAFPQISRVAILWPRDQQMQAVKAVETTGHALGIQIQSLVRSQEPLEKYFDGAFAAINRERPDALLVVDPWLIRRHKADIIGFTTEKRLPTMFPGRRFMGSDGLMSYGADQADLFRQTANYVAKILKGAKPADLPVERPRKFELIINLKTAKKLGLTFSPQSLARADKIIR